MARCKCRYDEKQLDTKTAFKVVIKEKNTYWCSDECYKKYLAEKEKKDKINAEYDEIYELTKQIFGYDFQSRGLLRREVDTWAKVSDMQKIIAYLKENQGWLSDVMSKEFASDFNRVRYYSTIVAGKLYDWKPRVVEVEKPKITTDVNMDEMMYEIRNTGTNKRRSLADLEDMF